MTLLEFCCSAWASGLSVGDVCTTIPSLVEYGTGLAFTPRKDANTSNEANGNCIIENNDSVLESLSEVTLFNYIEVSDDQIGNYSQKWMYIKESK